MRQDRLLGRTDGDWSSGVDGRALNKEGWVIGWMVEQSSDPAVDLVGSYANAVALDQLMGHILQIHPCRG